MHCHCCQNHWKLELVRIKVAKGSQYHCSIFLTVTFILALNSLAALGFCVWGQNLLQTQCTSSPVYYGAGKCLTTVSPTHHKRGEQLKDFPKAILMERDLIIAPSASALSACVILKQDYHWKFPALLEKKTIFFKTSHIGCSQLRLSSLRGVHTIPYFCLFRRR